MAGEQDTSKGIRSLPPEMLQEIAKDLDVKCSIALSLTCRNIQAKIGVSIIRVSIINDHRADDTSLRRIQNNAGDTWELRLAPDQPSELKTTYLSDSATWAFRAAWTPALRDVTDLSLDLNKLEISSLDWEELGLAEDDEPDEPMRKLLKEVYRTISTTQTPNITRLEINDWPPMESTVFSTNAWKNFLGQLEQFDITVAELNLETGLGSGYMGNRLENCSYVNYIEQMDGCIFKHLDRVRKVSIAFPTKTPIGANDGDRVRTPIPKLRNTMPELREIELRSFVVGKELVDFIVHAPQLRRVVFRDVTADVTGPVVNDLEPAMSWSRFFDSLFLKLHKRNHRLDHFELQCRAPLTSEDGVTNPDTPAAFLASEARTAKIISDHVAQDTARKLFGYSIVDKDTGKWFMCPAENHHSFFLGRDQKAHDRFMTMVGPKEEEEEDIEEDSEEDSEEE